MGDATGQLIWHQKEGEEPHRQTTFFIFEPIMAVIRTQMLVAVLSLPFLSAAYGKGQAKGGGGVTKEAESALLPPCAACSALAASAERAAGSAADLSAFVAATCQDVDRGAKQCKANAKAWSERLGAWWEAGGDGRKDLRQILCVEDLEVCCPEDSYGPDCKSCEVRDQDGNVCSGNGKCKGAGTRKGNGKCSCDLGFAGELCQRCEDGFYLSYKDDKKTLCSACHKSCKSHCTGPGAKGCVACTAGYVMDSEHGCSDIDECLASRPCSGNKFCVNLEGSYRCMSCDKACNGCEGDGPDSCAECADGYVRGKDGVVCITEAAAGRIFSISNTRFFTYAGLCIAACIIFQRSAAVAGTLGAVIAVYITLSEYYLMNSTGELKPIQ